MQTINLLVYLKVNLDKKVSIILLPCSTSIGCLVDLPGIHEALWAGLGLQAKPPLQLEAVDVAELPEQRAITV